MNLRALLAAKDLLFELVKLELDGRAQGSLRLHAVAFSVWAKLVGAIYDLQLTVSIPVLEGPTLEVQATDGRVRPRVVGKLLLLISLRRKVLPLCCGATPRVRDHLFLAAYILNPFNSVCKVFLSACRLLQKGFLAHGIFPRFLNVTEAV